MTEKEKKFVLELIEVYRSLTALWDVKSPSYNNRVIKEESYDKLLEKYREQNPEADKKELTRKLNSLRCSFRREVKRLRDAEGSGTGAQETSLYYFDALSFLGDVETPWAAKSISREGRDRRNRKRKFEVSATDESLFPTAEEVKPEIIYQEEVSDSYQKVANVWGSKLSELPRDQRVLAERIINEVLFEGKLGLLNLSSGLTNAAKRLEIEQKKGRNLDIEHQVLMEKLKYYQNLNKKT